MLIRLRDFILLSFHIIITLDKMICTMIKKVWSWTSDLSLLRNEVSWSPMIAQKTNLKYLKDSKKI